MYPTEQELIEEANGYKYGYNWVVIPLGTHDKNNEGKAPLTKGWAQLTIEDEVDFSGASNIGIICGKASGIVCLDIDSADRGVEIFNKLIEKYGLETANVPIQETPKNGFHYIFAYDERLDQFKSDSKLVKLNGSPIGIDLKTNKGQFVVYPSVNRKVNKPYKWIRHPFDCDKPSKMPNWIIKLLTVGEIIEKDGEFEIAQPRIEEAEKKYKSVYLKENTSKLTKRRTEDNTDIEYLFEIINKIPNEIHEKYDYWLKIGMAIFNFLQGNQIKTFKIWSQVCGVKCSNYDENEIENKVSTFKIDGNKLIGLTYLENLLKSTNPEGYEEIMKIYGKIDTQNNFIEHEINPEENYCWLDFKKEFGFGNIYKSEGEMIFTISEKIRKVLVMIPVGKGLYIKKDNCKEYLYNIVSSNFAKDSANNMEFKFKETVETKNGPKEKINRASLDQFLVRYGKFIPSYRTLVCKPNYDNNKYEFNVWSGYEAKLVNDFDINKIQPILDFLKEIWCNNDDKLYKYLLTWLYYLVIKPEERTKIALFIQSTKHGCGKNTFTDFLRQFIIGETTSVELNSLEPITQKHNSILQGKSLVIVNETSSTKDAFRNNFDKMKNYITDRKMSIEPKGKEGYEIDNLSNFIIISNHTDSIYLELYDRRYCCISLNDKYCQNRSYFGELRRKCFNQETGNHFYTYLNNMTEDELVDLGLIPETDIKKEIINLSKPSSIKFLFDLKQEIDDEIYQGELIIPASNLYEKYKLYCEKNKENLVSNSKFGLIIKNNIEKKRKKSGNFYDLSTIKI